MYTTAELRARVVDLSATPPPPPPPPTHTDPGNIFTDRSKALLLLWFTISVIVCVGMFILVFFLFLDSPLGHFGRVFFGVLLVVF